MSRSSRHSRSRVPTKRPANELARGAGTGWTEALGGIGLCLIVWWAADRARRWAPANVSASLAERPAEHVATAHHRLWSSRSRIPLRNEESDDLASSAQPRRVPADRSSAGSAVKSSPEHGHVDEGGGGHQAEPYGGAGLCASRVGHRSTECVHGLVQVVPEAVGGHCVLSRRGEQRLSALFLGAVCCRRA